MDTSAAGKGGRHIHAKHIAVSPLTVGRVTGGRYDWQDGELAKRPRRLVDDGRAHDPG